MAGPCRQPRLGAGYAGLQLFQYSVEAEAGGFLAGREFDESAEHVRDVGLGWYDDPRVFEQPVPVRVGGEVGALVGVGAQVEDLRDAELGVGLGPNLQRSRRALLEEDEL